MIENNVYIHVQGNLYGYGAIRDRDLQKIIKADCLTEFNDILSDDKVSFENTMKIVNNFLELHGCLHFEVFTIHNVDYFAKQLRDKNLLVDGL